MSVEAKQKYKDRLEEDFTFWCENEIWIRPKFKTKEGLVHLSPNPGQQMVIQTIEEMERQQRPIRVLILKARQWGCTTIAQSMVMHRSRFVDYHDSLVIGDREKTTRTIMAMNRRMSERFSPAVTDGWTRRTSQTDRFYEWSNGSILDIDTAGQAQASRGTTRDMIHGSEVAFWPNGGDVLNAMLPAVPDTPNSCVILETTSAGPYGIFWELWETASSEWSDWQRVFVPWNVHPEYRTKADQDLLDLSDRATSGDKDALSELSYLDNDELAWLLSGELDIEQLIWRKKAISTRFRGKEEDFKREFPQTPEDAWSASRYAFLSTEGRELQTKAVTDSECFEVLFDDDTKLGNRPLVLTEYDDRPLPIPDPDGCIHVLDEPNENEIYVIGVDPAEGTENDFSAAAVRCKGKIVCVFYRNDLPVDVFAEYLFAIGRWYNDALMVVERKGGGLAAINTLLRLAYPSLMSKETFDAFGNSQGKQIGFNPDQENLRSLYAMFRHTLNTGGLLLRHKRLFQEANWIIRKVHIRSDDAVVQKWVCPSKGTETPHGVRVSDDLFRAASLTELVSRDIEWAEEVEESDFTHLNNDGRQAESDFEESASNVYFREDKEISFPVMLERDDWDLDEREGKDVES